MGFMSRLNSRATVSQEVIQHMLCVVLAFVDNFSCLRSDSLHHQWRELEHLTHPANWPSSSIARERLLHRMLKDHAAISDQSAQLALAANERYDALQAAFNAAHWYHSDRHRRLEVVQETDDPAMPISLSNRESSITQVIHNEDGDYSTTVTMYT